MAIYYVDNSHSSASDKNSGSQNSPFRTIQQAADVAKAGDTVYVKAGVYKPFEIESSGTAGNHIVFSAFPGDEHEAIIDGSGVGVRGAIMAEGESHLTINGFRIQNARTDGIFIEGSEGGERDILISNNQIDTTGNSGIYVAGLVMGQTIGVNEYRLSDVIIENNEVTNTNFPDGGNEAISLGGGVDGFIIRNNWVHDSEQYGIDVKFGAKNGEIYGNLVHDIEKHGIYLDTNSRTIENVDIYNNTVYNATNGIVLARESARDPAKPNLTDVNIYDNLVYDNDKFGILAYKHIRDNETGEFSDITIDSNTIFGNGRQGIRLVDIEDYSSGWVVSNNQIFQNGKNIINDIGAKEVNNTFSGSRSNLDPDDGADAAEFSKPPANEEPDPVVVTPPEEPSVPEETSPEEEEAAGGGSTGEPVVEDDGAAKPAPVGDIENTVWLVDSATDQQVLVLTEDARIDPAVLSAGEFSIEVTIDDAVSVGSVLMSLDGAKAKVENFAPYALFGNNGSDFHGGSLSDGEHEIELMFYSGKSGRGELLFEQSYSFEVGTPDGQVSLPSLTDPESTGFESHYNVGRGSVRLTDGTLFQQAEPVEQGTYKVRYRSREIEETEDDPLYGNYGFGKDFQFAVDVPKDGTYRVELHLAELWHNSGGERIFDVALEGEVPKAFDDIDIFVLAGGRDRAITISETVEVSDGQLNIEVSSLLDNGLINGFSVYEVEAATF